MERKKVKWSYVLSMIGAMIAYYIGASTGSGQEFFQCYGTHGIMGVIGCILQHIFFMALALLIYFTCRKYELKDMKECSVHFLGKYVGTAVYYYSAAFVICTLVQLISGTGYILKQFTGMPYYIGSIGLCVLLILSVLCGFKKLISIISKIAPFIIVVMLICFIISLIHPADGLQKGSEMITSADDVYRTSDNWFGATVLHHTYLFLFLVPYFISCYRVDPESNKRENVLWIIMAFIALGIVCGVMVVSQVANVSIAMHAQAPNLAIASVHAPKLAAFLMLMIIAASYTTTAPIALIAADYFAQPDTVKYKAIGIAVILAGLGISFLGDYAQIINILVSVSGRIGAFVYIFAVIYKGFSVLRARRKTQTA